MSLQASNIQRVQQLVGEYLKGNFAGYLDGCADDFKGSVFAGLIPGGENLTSKADFVALAEKMGDFIEMKKFEPCEWRAVGDDVLFNVNWEFVWKATGKTHEGVSVVHKVVKDNLICEKYHMVVDVEKITGVPSPHDAAPVMRVQELLAEIGAGRPQNYMLGVAENVKASMLGGLIPGADLIKNKAEFMAANDKIPELMEVKKFEPCNFVACPNNTMMFNVKWQLVWKATGKEVECTAIVRKVLDADNNICEKYHMMPVESIINDSPRGIIDDSA